MNILLGITELFFPDYQNLSEGRAEPYKGSLIMVYYSRGKKIFRERFQTKIGLGYEDKEGSSCLYWSTDEIPNAPSSYTYTPKEELWLFKNYKPGDTSGDFEIKRKDDKKKYTILYVENGIGEDSEHWTGGADLRLKKVLDLFTYVEPPEEIIIHFNIENKETPFEEFLCWKKVTTGDFYDAVKAYRDPNFPIKFSNLIGPHDKKIIDLLREGVYYHNDLQLPLKREHKIALWWRSTPGTAAGDYAASHISVSLLQELWEATVAEENNISTILQYISPEIYAHFEEEMQYLTRDSAFEWEEDYFSCHRLTVGLEPTWGFFRKALVAAMEKNANNYQFLLD